MSVNKWQHNNSGMRKSKYNGGTITYFAPSTPTWFMEAERKELNEKHLNNNCLHVWEKGIKAV